MIVEQLVDAVRRQALGGGKRRDLSVLVAEKSMAACAEPENPMVVLKDRPDLLLCQRIRGRVMHKCARMQVAEAVVGADPNVAVLVLDQRARAEVGEAIANLVVLGIRTRDAAHSFIGGYPHRAIAALQEGPREVVGQS